MPHIPDPSRSRMLRLTALCTAAYFVSYISRINLSAAMVEIAASGFAPETTIALALSICSVTYGAGQILSGWLGDTFRPQAIVCLGFLLTGSMNLLVAWLPDPRFLCIIWAVNGFAQSMMWPPMVKLLSSQLNQQDYAKACMWVSWGSSFGTIAVYLFTPFILGNADFRAIFIVCGGCALGMAIVWHALCRRLFRNWTASSPAADIASDQQPHLSDVRPLGLRAIFLVGMVILSIMMQGALRDGVTNWLPTLLTNTFSLDNGTAILSGVCLPIFHILCTRLASWVYSRFLRNELICAGTIFAVGFTGVTLLSFFGAGNALCTVILLGLLVGCMHGVNLILVCMVPPYFGKYGHVSLISGIVNSGTYVGAAISTYGIALFSDVFGWHSTLYLWGAIAAVGMLICWCMARRWARFVRQS